MIIAQEIGSIVAQSQRNVYCFFPLTFTFFVVFAPFFTFSFILSYKLLFFLHIWWYAVVLLPFSCRDDIYVAIACTCG